MKKKKQLLRCFALDDRGKTRKRDSSTFAPVSRKRETFRRRSEQSSSGDTLRPPRWPVLPRQLYNGASTRLDRVPFGSCTSFWRASSRKTGAASRDARQQVRNCGIAVRQLAASLTRDRKRFTGSRFVSEPPSPSLLDLLSLSSLSYESINKFLVTTLLLSFNELAFASGRCSFANASRARWLTAVAFRLVQVRGTLFSYVRGRYREEQLASSERYENLLLPRGKVFRNVSCSSPSFSRDFHAKMLCSRPTGSTILDN